MPVEDCFGTVKKTKIRMICFMSYYLPDQFVAETQSTRMITIHSTLHNQFVVAFKTLSNMIRTKSFYIHHDKYVNL